MPPVLFLRGAGRLVRLEAQDRLAAETVAPRAAAVILRRAQDRLAAAMMAAILRPEAQDRLRP